MPLRAHGLHPVADIRAELSREECAEDRHPDRRPRRAVSRCLRVLKGQGSLRAVPELAYSPPVEVIHHGLDRERAPGVGPHSGQRTCSDEMCGHFGEFGCLEFNAYLPYGKILAEY